MKTKIFKIVLPAFALMLAITASLAFTPNNMEENPGIRWYHDTQNQGVCTGIFIYKCSTEVTNNICTTNIPNLGPTQLFGNRVGSVCLILMYDKPL